MPPGTACPALLWPPAADLVQGRPQSHLAADQLMSQAVVLLLQAQAGLLEPPVLLLRNTKNCSLVSKRASGCRSRTRRELSDQAFIQAVFLVIHYLQQAFLQLGFLGRDLKGGDNEDDKEPAMSRLSEPQEATVSPNRSATRCGASETNEEQAPEKR